METNQSLQKQESAPENSLTQKSSKPVFAIVLLGGNKEQVKQELARYQERGVVAMRKVLEIPMNERIPSLLEHPANYEPICTALVASLHSSLSMISVGAGMNEEQVLELAEMILESSREDNLGLEDVLLFLGELVAGKTGTIYNRLDIPTFFELFENYRERRHKAIVAHRDEEAEQFKALPINDRFVSEDTQRERDEIRRAVGLYHIQKVVDQQNQSWEEPKEPNA